MCYDYGMDNIFRTIDRLTAYGVIKGLIPERERVYSTNLILDLLGLDSYDGVYEPFPETADRLKSDPEGYLQSILRPLVDFAVKMGRVEDIIQLRDVFDTKLMNTLTPRPSAVIERFWKEFGESPEKATLNYYRFSKDTNYIRRDRIAKDEKWEGMTKYGRMEILVSLSKPELDPKAIAAAGRAKATGFPRCALCRENEGYAGRVDFAARQTHRIIPLKLCGESFSLQYSPYRYCHQHCIVLNDTHIPMIINESALAKLLEFISLFPHYFLGSNADLPYVGGSVLSHEHFQGGVHRLPVMDAKVRKTYKEGPGVEVSSLNWPLSTIRIRGKDRSVVLGYSSLYLRAWRDGYKNEALGIDPGTASDPHNTITPLAYREAGDYVMLLMLRNNKRTENRPDGLFHTHPKHFHIKKEGIGIIDAPGLAILPPRLKKELASVKDVLSDKCLEKDHPEIEKHAAWMEEIRVRHGNMAGKDVDAILRDEVVQVFARMLEDCGVFGHTDKGFEAFDGFIMSVLQEAGF